MKKGKLIGGLVALVVVVFVLILVAWMFLYAAKKRK